MVTERFGRCKIGEAMKPEKLFPAIRPDRRRVPDQEGKAALVAKIPDQREGPIDTRTVKQRELIGPLTIDSCRRWAATTPHHGHDKNKPGTTEVKLEFVCPRTADSLKRVKIVLDKAWNA
ncbi:hypothetical protein NKI34_25650 [Mesorhizobium sp. M0700]|uniref:hypothetical protein n=1 Tax=Mesorhizobium sp. M0700 TaxID=2956988 RepID=UPI00333D60BB